MVDGGCEASYTDINRSKDLDNSNFQPNQLSVNLCDSKQQKKECGKISTTNFARLSPTLYKHHHRIVEENENKKNHKDENSNTDVHHYRDCGFISIRNSLKSFHPKTRTHTQTQLGNFKCPQFIILKMCKRNHN